MSRFFSFLGTTAYLKCKYSFNNVCSELTHYVQLGIPEILLKTGEKIDEIVVFTTQKSYDRNYINNAAGGKSLSEGLKELKIPYKNVFIPEGKTKEEVYEIFDRVYGEIKENDVIVFDLTHSFRYIPMLAILIFNYAEFLKNVKIQAIYYGALEALEKEPKEIEEEKRIVPVFDLTGFLDLFQWTIGVERYLSRLDSAKIYELCTRELKLLRDQLEKVGSSVLPSEKYRISRLLREMAQNIKNFSDDLLTCRGLALQEDGLKLKKSIETVVEESAHDNLKLFSPLVEKLYKEYSKIAGNFYNDMIFFAELCEKYDLVQQGLTILEEGIISYLCDELGYDKLDENKRKVITDIAGKVFHKQLDLETEQKIRKVGKEIFEILYNLSGIRNDINHAGWRKSGATSAPKFKEKLREFISKAKDVIDFNVKHSEVSTDFQKSKKLLLIFSHSLTSEQEIEAREKLGISEFIKLPSELQEKWSNVPPEIENVSSYLFELMEWIRENADEGDYVLVEGDYGATYRIVNYCKKLNIIPVYATTKRIGEEEQTEDGIITKRVFKHVQFRVYE